MEKIDTFTWWALIQYSMFITRFGGQKHTIQQNVYDSLVLGMSLALEHRDFAASLVDFTAKEKGLTRIAAMRKLRDEVTGAAEKARLAARLTGDPDNAPVILARANELDW